MLIDNTLVLRPLVYFSKFNLLKILL